MYRPFRNATGINIKKPCNQGLNDVVVHMNGF